MGEKAIDWAEFRKKVTDLLEEIEVGYYIKKSLRDEEEG